MISHPTANELLDATIGFIEKITPQLKDRDVFLARVAINALATVRRENGDGGALGANAAADMRALLGRDGDFAALRSDLCATIRAGRFDDDDKELLRHLRASAIDQVRIDQPNYSGLKAALAADG